MSVGSKPTATDLEETLGCPGQARAGEPEVFLWVGGGPRLEAVLFRHRKHPWNPQGGEGPAVPLGVSLAPSMDEA